MMWLRIAILAAATIAGGAALGRRAVNRAVRARVAEAVEIARASAIGDLSREITSVVAQRVRAVAASLLWKGAIVLGFVILHEAGDLSVRGFFWSVIAVTVIFALRDAALAAPHLWRGVAFVRSHAWKPATALKEFVAGMAFERAYERALKATAEPGTSRAIALSSFSREDLSAEIAGAVRDVAKAASIRIVRLRAALGAAVILVFMLAYSGFLALALINA